jgi:plasmid maintenance system antidote protein VapI
MAKKLPPVHPGEILREEFLVSLKLTPCSRRGVEGKASSALHNGEAL